jgi:CRP-like cAMP-binding protein
MTRVKVLSDNALLRSLSEEGLDSLSQRLEPFPLRINKVIYNMEDPIDWVYFPEVGLLSIITVMVSGAEIETSVVGREGGVGFIEALGSRKSFSRVIVQVPGRALRIRAQDYQRAFDASASMRSAVHRQIELLQAESRQAIACHSVHTVERRLNRWLLECQDLAGLDVLPLKHEFLAVMLGVSRPSVSTIAAAAQRRGLIRYARGVVHILDRAGLESGACECRATMQYLRRELEPESVLAMSAAPPPDIRVALP